MHHSTGIQLQFAGATNLTAYAYSGPYVSQIYQDMIYWAYESYNYSQTIRVEYDVPCGHIVQMLTLQNTCNGYSYMMSPNPASTDVTISQKEEVAKKEKEPRYIKEINIYDKLGNLKKHRKFDKVKKASLNIYDLVPDIYIIEIVYDATKERQQLSIQR